MYIGVDFGQEESVDEVRLITSSDSEPARLELESVNAVGAWEKIATDPRAIPEPVPQEIRRMATREMHARGVHYLMLYDTNYGAEDFARDPEAWGLKLIGRGYGARLYQTIW